MVDSYVTGIQESIHHYAPFGNYLDYRPAPAYRIAVGGEGGKRKRVAEIIYRKGATSTGIAPRIVEPYKFTQGKQDIMVRCFQLTPEEGWRFFMVHKIDEAKDGGSDFAPRCKITLTSGEIHQEFQTEEHWTSAAQEYRDMVSDALADGNVTTGEQTAIAQFLASSGLSKPQRAFVHASIFHRCLGAIIDDGQIDEQEQMQLRFLHRVFSSLGWSPCDGIIK